MIKLAFVTPNHMIFSIEGMFVLRVLIITQYFWPEEFLINDITLQLQANGHQVEVLTGIPNYPSGNIYDGYGFTKRLDEDYKGVTVKRTWLLPRNKGGKLGLILNYLSFAFFASLKVLNPHFRQFDCVLVYEVSPITQALPALLLRKLFKIPVCLYVLDLWPESIQAAGNINNQTILKLAGKMVKFIYRRCDKILISSRSFQKNIQQFGYPESELIYLPNWADESYRPLPKDQTVISEINKDKFNVMFAGNIGSAQGFDIIIEAAERLKGNEKIHFVILGDGRMRSQAEKNAKDRGLHNISFLGRKPFEAMPSYFANADALLVTLKKDYIFSLTMPARVQAFMACGRPIIASVDGETAEIIQESKAGFVAPAGDVDGLVEAINKLYEMTDEEQRTIGNNGLNYSREQFSKAKLINRLDNIVKSMSYKERKVF